MTMLPPSMVRWMLWTAVYIAAAIGATWPLARHLRDHLPQGNTATSLPASAGAWALWWVSDRLGNGLMGLWEAPIFHPATGTFGYSEPTLPQGLASAPLFWLGAEPPTVYNLVVLACLVLNGLMARRLALTLGAHELAAGLAGLMLTVTPLTLHWLAVLPLVPLFGMLGFVDASIRFARDPSPLGGARVGAWLALCWLTSLQYGLFLTLLSLPLAGLVPWSDRRVWTGAAVAMGTMLALAGPALLVQRSILQEQGFARTQERAEGGGFALEESWLAAPVAPRLHLPGVWTVRGGGIYPGTVVLVLVGVAGWRRRREPEVWVLLGVTGAAVGLSVLPTMGSLGADLYAWMRAWVPGLALVREGKRAGALAVALLPVLAALGLDGLVRGDRRGVALAVSLVGLAMLDQWPGPARLQEVPTAAGHAELVGAIRANVDVDGVLMFLPYDDSASPTPEVDRMVLQAAHGRAMVNGYSSYYPSSYWKLRGRFKEGVTRRALVAAGESGVTHLVVRDEVDVPRGPILTELWRGEGQVLYRLEATGGSAR